MILRREWLAPGVLALLSLIYLASLCLRAPLAVPGAGFLTLNRAFEQRAATLILLPMTLGALGCLMVPALRRRHLVLHYVGWLLMALGVCCFLWYGSGPALIYLVAALQLKSNREPSP